MAEWQTRMFKGHVSNIVWVQVPLLAPDKNKTNPRENHEFVLFFYKDWFGKNLFYCNKKVWEFNFKKVFAQKQFDFLFILSVPVHFVFRGLSCRGKVEFAVALIHLRF